MGQINCQCQYVRSDDYDSFKRANSSLQLPPRTLDAPLHTRLLLRKGTTAMELALSDSLCTFGTPEQCEQRPQHLNGNSFKVQMRARNRCAYLRDCGVGLGAFLLKRKIIKRADGGELLLNVLDKWVLLKIRQSEQIGYSVHDAQASSKAAELERAEEHEIELGEVKLQLRRQREAKNYVIRRSDRREMWVLLTEERRVKANDVLRLGMESYEVQSVGCGVSAPRGARKY